LPSAADIEFFEGEDRLDVGVAEELAARVDGLRA
jgi:hypothetical protein